MSATLPNISLEERRALLDKPHRVSEEEAYYEEMKADVSVSVHHVNWMFETQSGDVIKTWLQDKTVDFKFPRQMSPLEYYSAGYCIAHSSAQWVLTFREHKEETDLKMFCNGTISTEEGDFKIGLRVLVFMASEKLDILFTNLGPHIQELHMKLRDGNISLVNLSSLQILSLIHI